MTRHKKKSICMTIALTKTTKLLLVDDDPSVVRSLKKIIERQFRDEIELTSLAEAIQGIAQVTEQSAVGSEEMASSSEELGAQASALRDLVSRFRTDNSGSGQRGTPSADRATEELTTV